MNKPELNRQIISVQNKTSESIKLSDFLAEFISANNIPDAIHNDLRLAAEEAFVNIVNYAFSKQETQTISIEVRCNHNAISITFIDEGIAFNPLLVPGINSGGSTNTNDLCDGGMGIHLIKSLTDKQEYNRINQRNVFTVTKNYSKHYTKKINK